MKLKTLAITAITTIAMTTACLAQDINVSLNGNIVAFSGQRPVVVDGRTLIPLRGVFDEMGYNIAWNGNTKTVTLTKANTVIVINIGESCYYINGTEHAIDVPAQIINGSTMLPLRAIADATGSEILWDADTKLATIIDADTAVTVPQTGTVITNSQAELNYVTAYTAILKDYSPVMTEYSTLLNSLITNGITEDSLNKLTTVSQNAYSKTIEAISKLSALEVPAKYTALNSATTKYLNSVASLSQLVLNLSNGSISSDEFESKFNSIGSQLMLDQAEYQRVFAEIIK
jgi:hypothetical protein